MTDKRTLPRALVTADRHVDARPDASDPDDLAQTPDEHVMPATLAHDLGKRHARRDKRADKARGNRHARRTARHDLASATETADP